MEIEAEAANEANLREEECLLMVQGKLIQKAIIKSFRTFKEKTRQASSRNFRKAKKQKQ